MATQCDLTLVQGDDPTVSIVVTKDGVAHSLVNQRIEIIVKPTMTSPDTQQLYRLTTAAGGDITIVSVPGGTAVADFTDRLANPGRYWYRAYVASVGDPQLDRLTFAYGQLTILAA